MPLVQRKEYNILLLGQTGVGKSMFINSFCNYVRFNDLKEALHASNIDYCVPTTFPCDDVDGESHLISVGSKEDENECQIIGQSGTKSIQSYLFELGNIAVRLIDTPGFGDTGGRDQDEKTCEHLIKFLSNRSDVQELHGIVFIAKPQENRFTTFFQYCLNQIFSKLHKDASRNIIFVFTHAKGTNYKPGPTGLLLERAIEGMSNVIPLNKHNIFCVENNCMQYLFAKFYGDTTLDLGDVELYVLPWKRSSDAYIRLLKYVKTLTPHSVQDTVQINEYRCYSIKLEEILGKMVEEINEKMKKCENYAARITERLLEGNTVEHLKFHTIYVNREGKHCVTCYNRNCPSKKGTNKPVCCQNCVAWTLSWCEQMSFVHSNCKKCGCSYLDHTFEKNEHNPEIRTEENKEIMDLLTDKRKDINEARVQQLGLQLDLKKYAIEKKYIEYWVHKLRDCLKETSILSDQQTYTSETRSDDANENESRNETFSYAEVQEKLHPKYFQMMGEHLKQLFEKSDIPVPNDKVYDATPILDNWKELED